MSQDLVLTRREGNVYVVTLNRENKRNALTLDLLVRVADKIAAVDSMAGVRAIILEAKGSTFSAGIDITELAAQRAEASEQNPARWLRRFAAHLQEALFRIENTEVPVIACIQGKCLGLGLELALACDFRVVADDAVMALPETRLGLIADVGGTTRLTKLIGPSRTKEMLMTAREVGADEAHRWGLANRVTAPEGLYQEADVLAQSIAQNAPLAVGLAKLAVDHGDGVDRHTQMLIERLAQSTLITTEDMGEAMAAFMERRPADFKGR